MTHLLHELRNIDDNLESVHKIQFSLFSHQDIKRGSVADILIPELYDSNIPKNNGLFDHNMGSIDSSIICPVDEKKAELCPGYFGKIDLALPVFNNHFVSYVEKLLKCVCFRCSTLLLDKSDLNVLKELDGKKGYNRFISVIALCSKNKKCCFNNGCFVLQPTKYVRLNNTASIKDKNNIIQIIAEFSQNAFTTGQNVLKSQNFTPLICYQIFKKIKDEDVDFLGLSSIYSRPEWMIITSLAVPPPAIRPSIRQSENQRSEDDLTYALTGIVKANKLLKQVLENGNSNNLKIDNYQGWLQYLVATYMDNEIPGVLPTGQRSTYRPLKAITQRLKGKEGRLRGNIMGKRVDYSARTVISVDPNINIDEFGVPKKIAMNLTFPEIITQYNIKKMRDTVRNGPKIYPGAKTVTKTGEKVHKNISLKHVDVQQIADNLEIGDIVHRHLIDGDVCLFNRQPTLHRMSMMTHKIKILPFSTFRLNVTVCKPYNADFDGDEMNMHIPQSLQTFTELEQICLVPYHIISPGTSTPSIEITQDTLLGAYLLTNQDVKLRRDQMNNYMMFSKKYNGILPEPEGFRNDIPYWTGKQLFSLILPDITINQIKTIKIIRGKITDGYLNSDSLGSGSAGLIKQIYNAHGMERCTDFLNDTQKLVTRWMVDNSFTIGFGDSIVDKSHRLVIREIINKYLDESFDLIKKAQHGVFANDLDDIYKGSNLECEIMKILSNLTEKVKDYVLENISKLNNFYQAGDKASGAKGKAFNIQQIIGCVGQQDIWGSRIEEGFTERTLPHFCRNDLGPDAKGFCRNSFIEGLTPSEMFFHAMGGRTGTIDTAIKTADSGYLSRKFIKAAEELMVNYDYTVRNSSNNIIQFTYGDDNFDPIKLEKITKIELIEYDNIKMEEVYKFDTLDDERYFENFMTPDAIKSMMLDDNYINILNNEYEEMLFLRNELRYNFFKGVEAIGDINTYIPINLYRVIDSQLIKFNIKSHSLSDLTPQYIINTFNETMKDIIKYLPEKENNWKLFKIIFKSFLSSKRVLNKYRMSKAVYDSIILLIRDKMMNSLVNPGEMVGIIGAQTLGEISTQLTLNSVVYETDILVRNKNNEIKKVQIGKFIESEIEKSKKIDYNKEKDTFYTECDDYYEVPSCDESGNTLWKKIEAVTKHPVINEDGTNTMLKIKTFDNREVIATKAKSFLQLKDGKIIAVEGKDLKVGDYLPVSKKELDFKESTILQLKNETDTVLDYNFGHLFGEHISGINISKLEIVEKLCPKREDNKFIHDSIIFSNKDCLKGFLDSYFCYNGIVNKKKNKDSTYLYVSLSMRSPSIKLLEDINVILKIFNITGHIRKSKRSYALYVLNQQSQKLGKMLNIKDKKKQFEINELLKRTFKYEYSKNYDKVPNIVKDRIIFENRKDRYTDIMFDKIVSIEEVTNTTNYAYDLTVKDTKNFDIYNSLCLRDTFHAAGVGSGSLVITEGIPRLREIIHISKNLKNRNMSIYLKEEYSNKDSAKKLQSKFCYTQLKNILQKSEILYSNNVTEKNEDYEFIKSYKEFTDLFKIDNIDDEYMSPWILRLIFDKESLMNKKISVQEIHETIKENFYNEHDIECIFSDDSVNDVVMRIRLKIDKNGNFLEFMKDFEKQLIELPLRGIININQVELSESNIIKYDNNGSFYATKEWILKTSGSNLLDILADDSVDINRTITNDIIEFYEIFGIEATRELIYRELSNVYSSKNPNPRHIQMLSDIMTYRGKLMQIDRHGLNKNSEIGPIAKASFEEVMNIFTKSAIFAEVDNMKGVSANIFAGQFCKAGTNCFDILIDEDKLLEKIDIIDYIEEEIVDDSNIEETFEKVYSKYDKNDDVKDEDFNFGFGIEQNKEHLLDKIITSDITISNIDSDSNAEFYNNIEIENVKYVKYENETSNSNSNSNSANTIPNDSANDNIDINFEKININEPKYEENTVNVDISKTKKIKVKRVKKN